VSKQLLNGISAQTGYSVPYRVNCRHLVKHKYNKPENNSENTKN